MGAETLRTVATEPVGHRADGASREEPGPTRGTSRTGPDRAEPSLLRMILIIIFNSLLRMILNKNLN
jgi:hypothetical protein